MISIILASNSPRRKEILSRYVDFSVQSPKIEENVLKFNTPEQLVMALAFEKGYSIAREYPEKIVIAADTVVSFEGEIMGKPKNSHEAFDMISVLSGNIHDVVTGYALFCLKEGVKYVDYSLTKVWFKELSEKFIHQYIATGSFATKAGGYGIQDYGSLLVHKIEGDYDNVVGLPISKISDDLYHLFGVSLMGGSL